MSSALLHSDCTADAGTARGGVSSGEASGVFAGRLPVENKRPSLDPYGMHRNFPELWARYLVEHYGTSRGRIMDAFSVDDRTVRAWLSGTNQPRGSSVAIAAARHPEFFAGLMEVA